MPLHRVDTFFPIIITQHIGALSDAEWQDRFARDQEQLRWSASIGQRTTTIYDMTWMENPTPTQREAAARYVEAHRALIEEVELGTAFIVPNPLMRGVLTAVFWLQGYPVPRVLVKDWDSAVSWCLERLKMANITPPSALQGGVGAEPIAPHLLTPDTLDREISAAT